MSSPLYQPLEPARQEIRLLKIQSREEWPIRCELITHSLLDPAIKYNAASYVWGDATDTSFICVNGNMVQTRNNLVSFLMWYRIACGGDRLIWADALCIDQGNIPERNEQVQMMATIYRSAKTTFARLGHEEGKSDFAVRNMWKMDNAIEEYYYGREAREAREAGVEDRDMEANPVAWITAGHADWFRTHLKAGDAPETLGATRNLFWLSAESLLRRPYWKRAWVAQELILSRAVMVVCGVRFIPLHAILGILLWLKRVDGAPCPSHADEDLWRSLVTKSGRSELGWLSLVHPSSIKPLGQRQDDFTPGDENWWPAAWRRLVLETLEHQATDPRDKLYSVLGMLDHPVRPDYCLPTERVFCDFAKLCLEADGRLDLLLFLAGHGLSTECCGVKPTQSPHTLFVPSWVPNWDLLSKRRATPWEVRQDFERMQKERHAACNARPRCWSLEDNALIVEGCSCDRVATVSMATDAESLASFFKAAILTAVRQSGGSYVSGLPLLQAFARTYFLDRNLATGELLGQHPDPVLILKVAFCCFFFFLGHFFSDVGEFWTCFDPTATPGLFRRVVAYDVTVGVPPDLLERVTTWLQALKLRMAVRLPVLPDNEAHRNWLGFHELLDNVIEGWNTELLLDHQETLFKTKAIFMTEKGRLGWGPPGMEAGDFICILGDGTPVVLRKVASHYLHIGVCFVLGFDYKEELEAARRGCEVETFRIV